MESGPRCFHGSLDTKSRGVEPPSLNTPTPRQDSGQSIAGDVAAWDVGRSLRGHQNPRVMAVSQSRSRHRRGRRRAGEEAAGEDGAGAGREQPQSPSEERGDIFRVPRSQPERPAGGVSPLGPSSDQVSTRARRRGRAADRRKGRGRGFQCPGRGRGFQWPRGVGDGVYEAAGHWPPGGTI